MQKFGVRNNWPILGAANNAPNKIALVTILLYNGGTPTSATRLYLDSLLGGHQKEPPQSHAQGTETLYF